MTEIVINYFKEMVGKSYVEKVMIALDLSLPELKKFEEYREAYYNK